MELYICTVVREDAIELFGFASWDERQTFLILTSISKVGAKTATAILGLLRPDDLRRIVAEDDWLMLTQVSGIGKKTAQHVFLELKYKLASSVAGIPSISVQGQSHLFKDVLAGLLNLGYDEQEALAVLKDVLTAEPDLDVSGRFAQLLKRWPGRKWVKLWMD